MKKILLSVFAVFMALAPVSMVLGADYLPKDKNASGNVVVSAGSEYKNLYVGGGSVIVNTKIMGDLFAAGGSVNLSGEVEEDFFAVGGNVTISSPVMGDVRVAGGNITINAPITGDLLVAGGTVSLGAGASVGGDMWVGGGVVNITAPITGNLKVAGGEIYINGSVDGVVDAQVDEKLTFGPQAVVLGAISYCGVKDPVIESGAQVGTITKVAQPAEARNYGNNGAGMFFGFSFMKTIMLLVAGLVLLWLMRARVNHVVLSVKEKFWHNVGMGFVAMVVIPILSIMLMVTFVGAILGMILLFWYIFALMLCAVFSMMTLGHFVEHWLNKRKKGGLVEMAEGFTGEKVTWKTILWGALAGIILGMIPVLGWLVLCAFYLGTFGSMLKMVKSKIIES